MLISLHAFSKGNGYLCFPVDDKDAALLEDLKLPGWLKFSQILPIKPENCGRIVIAIYKDLCEVKGNNIFISLDETPSYFETESGIQIPLHCEAQRTVEVIDSNF
jgi:hypothetical protein